MAGVMDGLRSGMGRVSPKSADNADSGLPAGGGESSGDTAATACGAAP